MTAPRKELLALAESCGAQITGKPDGSESITVVFSIEAWRSFDAALPQEKPEPQSHNGDYSVGFGRGWNACVRAFLRGVAK